MSDLETILADIESADARFDAQRHWNPTRVGEIDIRIDADGGWHHQGRPFRRDALVKLFAGVLRREGADYFLVTPVEKLRITVDDAPFVANLVERIDEALVFTTNLDQRIIADRAHPIRVATDADNGEPRPYLKLREGIEARIGRGAFFTLADQAYEHIRAGRRMLCVDSRGERFELGALDDD